MEIPSLYPLLRALSTCTNPFPFWSPQRIGEQGVTPPLQLMVLWPRLWGVGPQEAASIRQQDPWVPGEQTGHQVSVYSWILSLVLHTDKCILYFQLFTIKSFWRCFNPKRQWVQIHVLMSWFGFLREDYISVVGIGNQTQTLLLGVKHLSHYTDLLPL